MNTAEKELKNITPRLSAAEILNNGIEEDEWFAEQARHALAMQDAEIAEERRRLWTGVGWTVVLASPFWIGAFYWILTH